MKTLFSFHSFFSFSFSFSLPHSLEAEHLVDRGAVEGRRGVNARREDVDVVSQLAEALDEVGEADLHSRNVREGGRLC